MRRLGRALRFVGGTAALIGGTAALGYVGSSEGVLILATVFGPLAPVVAIAIPLGTTALAGLLRRKLDP